LGGRLLFSGVQTEVVVFIVVSIRGSELAVSGVAALEKMISLRLRRERKFFSLVMLQIINRTFLSPTQSQRDAAQVGPGFNPVVVTRACVTLVSQFMRPVRWVRDAQHTMFNLHKNTLESAAPIRPVRANGLMCVCQTPEVFNHTFPIGKTSSIAFSGLISNLCVASTSL
jgi:hypothetical protein